jgi:hypothetical protein
MLLQVFQICEQVSRERCVAPLPFKFGNEFSLLANVVLGIKE